MSVKANKLILLDADVVSHFISGGQFGLLPQIFSNEKVILDIVAIELRAAKKFRTKTTFHWIPFAMSMKRNYIALLRKNCFSTK